jgi:CheY-like chemotaxis protein
MRVLIADDDAVSRRLLHSTLVRWNYEVVACADRKSTRLNSSHVP